MSADVPMRGPVYSATYVKSGRPVRGPTFSDAVLCAHKALGHGAQLLPETYVGKTLTANHTYRLQFYVRPTLPNFTRLWVLRAYGATDGVTITINEPAIASSSRTVSLGETREGIRPVTYTAHRSSQTSTLGALAIEIAVPSGGSDVVLETIACVEVPRLELATSTTDLGFDLARVRPSSPIYADGAGTDIGLNQLADALATPANIGRRASLFSWAVPYLDDAAEVTTFAKSTTATSGAPDAVFTLKPPVLRRPHEIAFGSAPTTGPVTIAALCFAAAGTVGEVDFTGAAGGGTTLTHNGAGAWAWVSDTMSVHLEDQTASDGRRSSTWDDLTINFYRVSGAATFYVAGIAVLEDTF